MSTTARHVVTPSGSYLVVPSGRLRTTALALVPLVDEWSGDCPPDLTADSLTPLVAAHVTGGHLVLTGLVERAWPHLAAAPQQAIVRLRRPGRRPQQVIVDVPAGSPLPLLAAPVALDAVVVTLLGHVRAHDFPQAPIAGATVTVSGQAGTDLVAVWPPLSAPHPAGATVTGRMLGPATTTALAAPAAVGESVLAVLSDAGFAVGDVLVVDGACGGTVATLLPGGVVLLTAPLPLSAPVAAVVEARTPGPPGAAGALTRAALPGDGLLPVSAAVAEAVVEVAGSTPEFRATTLTTDADGRWRLAGVRGVPDIVLTTTAGGFTTDGPTTRLVRPVDPFPLETELHP